MRILVAIANYGTKNDDYFRRLLQEYRSMPYDVHIVAICNLPKQYGDDVEVIVHTPSGDPWSFPFIHKKVLAERYQNYDLVIYSEDDTLIKAQNIEAFLKATAVLPESDIAGFIRSEQGPNETLNFPTVHAHFRWDPRSVVSRGPYTFAFFSNHHSACYMLTQDQLKRAIRSGGYLVGPHQGKYDLLVTAATDPYTQCGFRKLVCISHLDDFVLPHLPNKYVGKLGVSEHEMQSLRRALVEIGAKTRPQTVLLEGETKLQHTRYSKNFYEHARKLELELVPAHVRTVLSYGCGWGAIESKLVERGIQVTAVPLDSVIAACAEENSIEMIYADTDTALQELSGRRFDCIFLSNILHLVSRPDTLLTQMSSLLHGGGTVVATVPNLSQAAIRRSRRIRRSCRFQSTGVHRASYRMVKEWFRAAKLRVRSITPIIPQKAQWINSCSAGLLSGWLAEEFVIAAETTGHTASNISAKQQQIAEHRDAADRTAFESVGKL